MPDLERILQGTPGTLTQQWYEDGTAVDPGTVTVGITRADGTVLVAPGTATTGSGTGARNYSLTTSQTALLDTLTITWTSTGKGALTSTLEVVGGFLFSLTDLASEVSASTSTYTAAQMRAARTYAETELEQACGVAFVPRYTLDTISGDGGYTLMFPPRLQRIRSVTDAGVAWSVGEIAALTYSTTGSVYSPRAWTAGTNNLLVGYEHGYSYPSPGASEAALVLAKHKLVRGPIDERATQRASEFGPVNLATPGMFGSRTGIPVVDAFISANSLSVGLA